MKGFRLTLEELQAIESELFHVERVALKSPANTHGTVRHLTLLKNARVKITQFISMDCDTRGASPDEHLRTG